MLLRVGRPGGVLQGLLDDLAQGLITERRPVICDLPFAIDNGDLSEHSHAVLGYHLWRDCPGYVRSLVRSPELYEVEQVVTLVDIDREDLNALLRVVLLDPTEDWSLQPAGRSTDE